MMPGFNSNGVKRKLQIQDRLASFAAWSVFDAISRARLAIKPPCDQAVLDRSSLGSQQVWI
jgi:hypothetical protein